MKRFIKIAVAVIIILVISNILSRGASSADLPADVQRVAGSPRSESVSVPKYARQSSGSEEPDPNSSQQPESADTRFERARIRYRNVAQQLLTSLADWEQRVQETLQKLEKFQADWERSSSGKNKKTGELDLSNRTGQEDAVTNDQNIPASKTLVNGGLSKPGTTNVSSDKISDISRNAVASENLGLQEPNKNKQAEELALQCERVAEQLLNMAKQLRSSNRILE